MTPETAAAASAVNAKAIATVATPDAVAVNVTAGVECDIGTPCLTLGEGCSEGCSWSSGSV